MKYLGCILLVCLFSCKNVEKESESHEVSAARRPPLDTAFECQSQRTQAISDYNDNSMKYYFYGVAYPSKSVVDQLKELKIQIVTNGCIPEGSGLCYNQFVDSIVAATAKVDISAIR